AGKGDSAQERVLRLARIQPGVLANHRHIRLDYAGELGFQGNLFRVCQVVEAYVLGSLRGNGQVILYRRAVRIENRQGYVSLGIRSVQDAHALMAGHLGLRPVTCARDVAFGNRPAFPSDTLHDWRLRIAHHSNPLSAIPAPTVTASRKWPSLR